jgi:hypothetical protein
MRTIDDSLVWRALHPSVSELHKLARVEGLPVYVLACFVQPGHMDVVIDLHYLQRLHGLAADFRFSNEPAVAGDSVLV